MLSFWATEQIYLTAEAGSFQKEQSAFVVGCTQSFLAMAQMSLCEGRLLYPVEWRSGNRQVLVGQKLAQSLDVSAGDMLFVEGRVFCVCGIMSAGNGFSRVDTEQAVFLPIDVLCEIAGNTVHEITLDVPEGHMPHKAAEKAKAILEKERNIAVCQLRTNSFFFFLSSAGLL